LNVLWPGQDEQAKAHVQTGPQHVGPQRFQGAAAVKALPIRRCGLKNNPAREYQGGNQQKGWNGEVEQAVSHHQHPPLRCLRDGKLAGRKPKQVMQQHLDDADSLEHLKTPPRIGACCWRCRAFRRNGNGGFGRGRRADETITRFGLASGSAAGAKVFPIA
jgi:hypothetical protein